MNQSVTITERMDSIDIIRGFAIFGIFFVNFAAMIGIESTMGRSYEGIDAFVRLIYDLFFQMKFYTIFSFLFGLGFYIFMNRAEARGVTAHTLFIRRLLFLFILGFLHFVLLWFGDILHSYAIFGFALLLFYRLKPKTILIWALVFITIFIGINGLVHLTVSAESVEAGQSISQSSDEAMGIFNFTQANPYEEYVTKVFGRSFFFLIVGILNLFIFSPEVVGLFLLGLYAGKINFFQRLSEKVKWLRYAQLISFIVAIVFMIPIVKYYLSNPIYASEMVSFYVLITGKALALFYVSTICLLSLNERWKKRLKGLGYVGRMALTNYLIQTIMTTVLFSIFVKHTSSVPLWVGTIYCFLFFCVQIVFSKWWLSRYDYGPMEWAWRMFTYWKVQPLKRKQTNE